MIKLRITNYNYGLTGNINDYTYNSTDDRLTHKLNAGSNKSYNYDTKSHKLESLSGASTDSMTYDANGNILTASGKTYTYNAANRMLTSNNGSITTNYLINFMGQRTKKSNSNDTTWFIYDENDNLIAEYDENGNLVSEYVYMNDIPIALIRNSNIYYIYIDHLNTPRAVTDISNNLVWSWENKEAFGNNQPDENVSVTQFNFNFRFPGQYFDIETGLNYNINRDYNPVWGRYMTSDPLGLSAGLNTYSYADLNPLSYIDPEGLRSPSFSSPYGRPPVVPSTREIARNSKLKTEIPKISTNISTYNLLRDIGNAPTALQTNLPGSYPGINYIPNIDTIVLRKNSIKGCFTIKKYSNVSQCISTPTYELYCGNTISARN